MLEGLATWVLNTYIGKYLENLNTDQLSIGVLKGEVELENLPLKKDAFKYLELPIHMKAGFVGKIRLRIPLYRLRSEPWVISIEKLFLVAGPLSDVQYDEEQAEQLAQEYKLSQLDDIEAKWKAENEAKKVASYYANSYSSWMSFGSSIFTHTVQNIQFKVKDVHIRYEDNSTIPGSSFAFGILIRNLSSQSVDETWDNKYMMKDSSEVIWKLLELDDLAVYWDCSATMLGHLDSQELSRAMQRHMESCTSSQGWTLPHDYLLCPVSAKARLQRNCSSQPLRSRSTPRIICDLELERIALALSEVQYKQMVDWVQNVETKVDLTPKTFKPSVPPQMDVKGWWQYAYQFHLAEIKKRRSQRNWTFAVHRVKDVLDYVEVYHTHLVNPEGLTPTMKARKDSIEHDLSFEDLCVLRLIVTEQLETESRTEQEQEAPSSSQGQGRGLLMSWFPSWSGWYSSSQPETPDSNESEADSASLQDEELQSQIDSEILDVLDSVENDTVLRRDTVFARLNFSLHQGTFTLLSKRNTSQPESPTTPTPNSPEMTSQGPVADGRSIRMMPFMELEFSDVTTTLETRPRNGSHLFEIKLGALYLHDKLTSKPIFPHIIFPQNREISVSHSKNVLCGMSFTSRSHLYRAYPTNVAQLGLMLTGSSAATSTSSAEPIFKLSYEKNPLNSRATHRLAISTKPLEIIYNLVALETLREFFSLSKFKGQKKWELRSAARSHYENIKQQTKTELLQRLDQIFDTEERIPEAVTWEIDLDISAPQIIVPEDMQDKNSVVVVLDLGRLQFSNCSLLGKDIPHQNSEQLDSEDEEFKTPCSTPMEDDTASTATWFSADVPDNLSMQDSSSAGFSIRDKFYEKYTLHLCDMQILVARAKDNWKFAQIRGTSAMHVLDRFSISLLLERRLILSSDQSLPALTLSGTLPKMVLHINEQKVQALRGCAGVLGQSARKRNVSRRSSQKFDEQFMTSPDSGAEERKEPSPSISNLENIKQEKKVLPPSSVLLLMEFCVEQMSLEVQSRGRSIAELQVTGVKSTVTKRPLDLSVSLCVHSLLLVDAVQTYGPDFELLVASHQKISMDSMSGSIKDSEPNSPTSPASPDICSSPPASVHPQPPCSTAIKVALSSLQTSGQTEANRLNTEKADNDALITFDLTIVNGNNRDECMKIMCVQFNNLDVIANQETIVELVGFVQRVSAHVLNPKAIFQVSPQSGSNIDAVLRSKMEPAPAPPALTSRTEVTFDFHRLNILLLQSMTRKRSAVAKKIATATLSGAKIQASFGKEFEVTGVLGGLQVIDLITEDTNHQRILSVGHDPSSEKPVDLMSRLEQEVYKPKFTSSQSSEKTSKALTFEVKQSLPEDDKNVETLNVNVRMASVCYTHAPRPLHELACCATEFQEYVMTLARSIKSAAKEVAKGFVSRWPDGGSHVFLEEDEFRSMTNLNEPTSFNSKAFSEKISVRLDVLLQTPIIVFPSSPSSFEVLVAHLGRIAIQNVNSGSMQSSDFHFYSCDPYRSETVLVEVKDMNLYSLNIEENMLKFGVEGQPAIPSQLAVQDLYSCTSTGQPILHDTRIECSVEKLPIDRCSSRMQFDEDETDFQKSQEDNFLLQIQAEVMTPLKVVLSKTQYEQVLDSLSALTVDDSLPMSTNESVKEDAASDTSETPPDEVLYGTALGMTQCATQGNADPTAKGIPFGSSFLVHTSLSVPELSIQLVTEERKQGLVKLSFQMFCLDFNKVEDGETLIQITLHGLIMEDLMEPLSSKHRLLMASVFRTADKNNQATGQGRPFASQYLSTSCPDITYHAPHLLEFNSLPDHLDTQNLFKLQQNRKKNAWSEHKRSQGVKEKEVSSCPRTPPPSPSSGQKKRQTQKGSGSTNALVNIAISMIDPQSALFLEKYNKVHKRVDIDFNCLETIINLQTWVMVFDFFGIGAEGESPTPKESSPSVSEIKLDLLTDKKQSVSSQVSQQPRRVINSDYFVTVSSLTLVLNKVEYELARANVSSFQTQLSFREGNLSIQGSLGSMSLLDLTHPHKLYKERFITTGKEALHFDIFKFGKADPDLTRDYDISVKCQMASVRYVHTRRFLAETLAFFQYFNQLHDFMVKIRAAAGEAMLVTSVIRGSRIQLDVSAGSPIIIIPQHHASSDVLVADLGKLYVHNTFLLAGSPGTLSKVTRVISPDCSTSEFDFETATVTSDTMTQSVFGSLDGDTRSLEMERSDSRFMIEKYFEKRDAFSVSNHVCLLDVMNVEMTDMDLYSAEYISKDQDEGKALVDPTKYEIEFPSFFLARKGGQLLKETFMLRVQVERNLDADISHSVPDMTMHGIMSSVHFVIDQSQLLLVLGILNHNLGEPSEEFTASTGKLEEPVALTLLSGQAWPLLSMNMDLVNVTLELVYSHPRPHCANSGAPLAKFDFIKSRLCYESFSNTSKDVDLVSHQIKVLDTRYQNDPVNTRPNVFTNILQSTQHDQEMSLLQAEVHYRNTKDLTCFTVLLNNMRVMCILDWLKLMKDFISVSPEPPLGFKEAISLKDASSLQFESLKTQSMFELKLNVTDTELVIIENTALWDSNAIILKATAVLSYRPGFLEKPLSCSLQSLEVFSAILGVEDETAMSIIDPVTINIDVTGKSSTLHKTMLTLDNTVHTLEVSVLSLNLRLSYYDMTFFLQILDSFKHQLNLENGKSSGSTPTLSKELYPESSVQSLRALGFKTEDCLLALDSCEGKLDEAALWLTDNKNTHKFGGSDSDHLVNQGSDNKHGLNIRTLEIRVEAGCLCIIDDCDADVPLLEITVSDFFVQKKYAEVEEGFATFLVSSDYFNRSLSGWEPFLEPWRCTPKWKKVKSNGNSLSLKIEGDSVLNVNFTRTLLDLYSTVKKTWTEDYYKQGQKEITEDPGLGIYRNRLRFVPFAIKNDTGCKLQFAALTSTDSCSRSPRRFSAVADCSALNWTTVLPNQVQPFSFEGRDKIRHDHSGHLKIHQLVVQVEGWHQVVPVSIDRVGIYFRQAEPQIRRSASAYVKEPPARVVFDVTTEGSSKKLVTVRSALLLRNKLRDTLEVQLRQGNMHLGATIQTLFLVPDSIMPVPLNFVHAQIFAKPSDKAVVFPQNVIEWKQAQKPMETSGSVVLCKPFHSTANSYRYYVLVKHQNYPSTNQAQGSSQIFSQPGHKITFLPPLELENLLPYELHFTIYQANVKSYIKPGKSMHIHNVNIKSELIFQFTLENFGKSTDLIINWTTHDFMSRLELYDSEDRLLVLFAKITVQSGGSLKVSVIAPYWIVNRTGLPLVFKQEGTQGEAAGQMKEHETARSVTPLLFSLADEEASVMCCMRVGRNLHTNASPQWSSRFHLEKGISVRRLRVTPNDSRPDWVYVIGIEVQMGKGRFQDTYIVTLSPRFQLENKSSHKLEFAQRFATKSRDTSSGSYHGYCIMSAMPKCSLPFHWPRIDLDNLLCVRLVDEPGCRWSGGFIIEKISSFRVNMRDEHGKSLFLRVEIVLQGARFIIIFTDADKMPPPFRIDNMSDVSIIYYQTTNNREERIESIAKPHSSVPYAFDEPSLPPFITCCAPGGSSDTYNMDVFGDGERLFYENFIYIVFTGTFQRSWSSAAGDEDVLCQELVLDVPQGTRVVLSRKEPGQRSQLWRMNSKGMIQHEGSSPPRDLWRPSSSPGDMSRCLFLDIAGPGAHPAEQVPLMLRKGDERRSLTQTWRFTEDGRLCCGHPNVYVQPKDGYFGMKPGSDAVLGPNLPIQCKFFDGGIPIEQAVSTQKLRKGSGMLSVRVVPDGPTRVLQITDFMQKEIISRTHQASDWVVVEERIDGSCNKGKTSPTGSPTSPTSEEQPPVTSRLTVTVHLLAGLGLSIVNHLGEELIYTLLQNIMVEYCRGPTGDTLDGSIQNVQVDNQLRDAERSAVLFLSLPNKKDQMRHLPALHIMANRVSMPHINAEIFKHLIVTGRPISLQLEEKLLLKLVQFLGFDLTKNETELLDELDNQIPTNSSSSEQSRLYYFGTLKLKLPQVRLSMVTTSKMPKELRRIKKKMGWTLIRFEDAVVQLDPFLKVHPFETAQFLQESILDHYEAELRSQAAQILGSVNFLGNPLGLVNDVSDGLIELFYEGNVGGLVKNVAHGLSNTAAKMTGTLSDSLGMVTLDDKHQNNRKRIRQDASEGSTGTDQFVAGLRGLGIGLVGGVTSLVMQTYEGAVNEGVPGFFSGLGKGIVGTVTKPTVGILDFASGAASAVRDKSKRRTHIQPSRIRPSRICAGPGGLLIRYSLSQSLGQELLYSLNNRNYDELLVVYEQLQEQGEDLRILVTSHNVYVISRSPPSVNVIMATPFKEIFFCEHVASQAGVIMSQVKHYIQFNMIASSQSVKRPMVRCQSEEIAKKISQLVNYAKSLYEEKEYTVNTDIASEKEKFT